MQVALDQKVIDSEIKLAIHTNTSAETVFVSGTDVKSHLESTGIRSLSLTSHSPLCKSDRYICTN